MLRRAVAVLVAFVALLAAPRIARADAVLYTIGPGSYLFSRYGHSLICVDARCYDYGVPDRDEAVHMTWASIRGQAIFVPVAIDESFALEVFRSQGRSIDKQRLPIGDAEVKKLKDLLERDVREKRAYAYHPYFANCTTAVRDRLDEALGGRLRQNRQNPVAARFRDLSEEGLSGRLGELTLLAFLLGDPAERKPTGWEVMFLPDALRDGVTEQLRVVPERLEETKAVILPTSRAIGRAALVILAVILVAVVGWGAKRLEKGDARRARIALGIASAVLGGMALVAELVALLVVWPEFRHNWALVALLPTDLAMPWLSRRHLAIYARARAALAGGLFVLELAGVVAAPIIPVCVLVALPMLSIGSLAKAMAVASGQRATRPIEATG